MGKSDTISQQAVTISGARIIVSNMELIDDDLALYLTEFSEESRIDLTRRALKIGLLALRGSTAIDKADYVEKEFGKLSQRLDQRVDTFVKLVVDNLDRVFGEDRGVMRSVLDRYLGTGGKLDDLFDPERKDSAIARISAILDQHFRGRDSVLYTLLDHSNPESPLFHLKKDLVENYLQDIRDRLIGEQVAAEEYERGTAKGIDYQESVFEMVSQICRPFGDIPSYVADSTGKVPKSKVGDIVVDVNPGYTGGVALRMVIEAKDQHGYNAGRIVRELEEAKENRDACVALMTFTAGTCPDTCYPLEQYGDDKLVCVYDQNERSDPSLQLAYRICRIEALRRLSGPGLQIDMPRLRALVTQCSDRLRSIAPIKAKVTRWANDVNADLDSLYEELSALLREVDSATMGPGEENL